MSKDMVVLTASAGAFPGLADALAEMPVQLVTRPLLSFEPPADWGPLDGALRRRHAYQAVALTSPRAAQALVGRMDARGVTWDEGKPFVWVVGPATEESLQRRVGGVRKPDTPQQAGEAAGAVLARAMIEARVGGPVLFLCGDRRRDELPDLLRSHGVSVDEVVCYRTILASQEEARAAAAGGSVVIVASPSVAILLAEACPGSHRPRLVAIGATTAEAAHAAGWLPAAVAAEPSTRALAAAVTGLLATR